MQRAIATAAVLFAALLPAAATELSACARDPRAQGLEQRMEHMNQQMERIERSTDRGQQRHLMELHMKKMHEGMRQLRRREAGEGCRLEMMHAMMEQMMRHRLVEQDAAAR